MQLVLFRNVYILYFVFFKDLFQLELESMQLNLGMTCRVLFADQTLLISFSNNRSIVSTLYNVSMPGGGSPATVFRPPRLSSSLPTTGVFLFHCFPGISPHWLLIWYNIVCCYVCEAVRACFVEKENYLCASQWDNGVIRLCRNIPRTS